MLAVFLFCFLGSLRASIIEREFSFRLDSDETEKSWEINVPFPSNQKGQFIGREFQSVVNSASTSLRVESENLTATNYYAKGKIVHVCPKVNRLIDLGILHVKLLIGPKTFNDTPRFPPVIAVARDSSTIKVKGFWDAKRKKINNWAKYCYYQLKNENSNTILKEEVISIYSSGLDFPINYQLQKDTKYLLVVQVSNICGKYSTPFYMKFTYSSAKGEK